MKPEIICDACGAIFIPKFIVKTRQKPKFCSKICFNKSFIRRIEKVCVTCKRLFKIRPSDSRGKFCSILCIRYQGPKEAMSSTKGKGVWQRALDCEDWLNLLKINFDKAVIKNNEKCWSSNKKNMNNGYFPINIGSKKSILAHRASWLIHRGEIPNKLWVLHKCDNPSCTNPEHLFLGTAKDNNADKISKNRHNAPRGQMHHNVKLSDLDVKHIKSMIKDRYSQKTIAIKFNVSPSTIQNIVDGKTWKHI